MRCAAIVPNYGHYAAYAHPPGRIRRTLPTKTDKLPSGSQWLHEINHDGFRIIARKNGAGETLQPSGPVACNENGVASFDLIGHHRANESIPGRNLFLDGGQSTGKKKSTDDLNIFYTPPRPKIIQSVATQDPDAGIVDLDYNTARFVVQYDDIEQVRVLKK